LRFWVTAGGVTLLDQLTKLIIIKNFVPGESLVVIDGFLKLTYVQNFGAAFGILQGESWFLLICAIALVAGIVIYQYKQQISGITNVVLAIIVGGAVGNLLDRWIYGYVIDFFDLGWWPVFNIADIAIVSGGIILAGFLLRDNKGEV